MALLIDFRGAGRLGGALLSGDGGDREDAILCVALSLLPCARSGKSSAWCEASLKLLRRVALRWPRKDAGS